MPCPDPNLLSDFAQGILEEPALLEVEQHLDGCPECRHRLAMAAVAAEEKSQDQAEPTGLQRGARLGRYILLDKLGRGGMGLVLRAYDPELDRRVAIKVLDQQDASEEELAALLSEARAAARLEHPNVVVVYDVGREGSCAFVAMEHVEGGSLGRWLKAEKRTPRQILSVLRAAGEGLAAAHRAGLVHRDFKPHNVLLGLDGRPRVADFGLARFGNPVSAPSATAGAAPASPDAQTSTRACGTPGYMPPEQYDGQADARADVFAYCVSAWEALAGERPFPSAPEGVEAIRQGRMAGSLPRGVPARIRRALVKGLSPRPEQRFATMDELLQELAPPRATKWAWPLATAAVVAAAATGLASFQGRVDPCADPPSRLAWDDGARAEARAAFLGSGRSYAEPAFADFDRALSAWSARSVQAFRDACLDAHAGRPEGPAPAREACLKRSLLDAGALAALARRADAAFVDNAAQAVRSLLTPESCADPLLAGAAPPRLTDETAGKEAERILEGLSQARALLETGAWGKGRALAAELGDAAAATGIRPLLAEALLLRGSAEHLSGALEPAEATLRRAAAEADAAGVDRVRVQALVLLGRVVGEALRRPAEGEASLAAAGGALSRIGSPAEMAAELDFACSQVVFVRGDYDAAAAAMQNAAATWERLGARGTVGLARALAGLSAVEVSRGRLDQGEAVARRALEVGGDAFPQGHPARSEVLSALAGVRLKKGDPAEAAKILDGLGGDLEATLGKGHPDALWARVLQGMAELGMDRPDRAAATLRRALGNAPESYPRRYAILRQLGTAEVTLGEAAAGVAHLEEAHRLQVGTPGVNPVDEAVGRAHLARGLLAAGRAKEALAHAEASVGTLAGKVPEDSERMGLARLSLGGALLASGRAGEAALQLEKAVAAHEKIGTFAARRAEGRWALSRALADRARARDVARQALEDLEKLGYPVAWKAELAAAVERGR
jgi:tetratricopeptide (TPR) repeat protein/predicted Ser/Thr protein kinase